MKFDRMPSIFPGQKLYGAMCGPFTFVISDDGPDGFTASAKLFGATPLDGTRHDLGGYGAHRSLDDAKAACEAFFRQRHS